MHGLQDIDISFMLVFEDNPPRYEKCLHLPSTKLDDPFHINKKTFEIFMKQSQFHQNGVPPPKARYCKEATSSFLQAVKSNKEIML
jgi:hypothetical protein